MAQTLVVDKKLAQAVTEIINILHYNYSGITVRAVSGYEDEDFTLKIIIPETLSAKQVLDTCHQECIKIEDEYDLFILPIVVYE
ncbi:hypothetical protein QUF70_08465 [Desulfobacterales bacterium HSG17]|nr:hypothetical protein [Desulfobacterales bacterium HSG17]